MPLEWRALALPFELQGTETDVASVFIRVISFDADGRGLTQLTALPFWFGGIILPWVMS